MITTKQQAKIIETRLNNIAEICEFKFHVNLAAIAGDFLKSGEVPIINGIFIEQQSSVVPVKGLNAYYTSFALRLATKREFIDNVDTLLQSAVGGLNGLDGIRGVVSTETDGAGVAYSCVTNCSMPTTSELGIEPGIGECVIFELLVFFQLVEGGILSNSTYFELQTSNMRAPIMIVDLDSTTARVRIDQTDNLVNEEEMQAVIGQQGLQFNLTVPYLTGEPYKTLMSDALKGRLETIYKLRYIDKNVQSNDLEWFVVMKEATLSRQAGKVLTMSIQFVIARADVYDVQIKVFSKVGA